ncbi:mpv17-like protein 2 [Daphnia magna]|uniref:Mpv17 protein 2 n=2 Tax=Daphnia magna TaxID=35525 RepID=A0A0P6ANT0_9CRUS|nr:mpv17-like protein 2 [Daphnia magna]KAK4012017.1 hypothetical protein OUZ56_021120 [Daphnia magna]KZS11087.1 Mpv17 protein 2 [Daphnia magna]
MIVKSFALSLVRLKWSAIIKTSKVAGKTLFSKYLLITNVTISTSLSGIGDTLQQQYEILTGDDPNQTWNKKRTVDMSATGTVVGVICHFWYNWLDKRLPGKTFKIVLKKLLVDQVIFSPFLIAVFFGTVGVLEHMSTAEVLEEIKAKAWRLYAAEWVVWPPAQLINFYLLPTRFRVLYDNTISLGYDVYTSYVKHDKT